MSGRSNREPVGEGLDVLRGRVAELDQQLADCRAALADAAESRQQGRRTTRCRRGAGEDENMVGAPMFPGASKENGDWLRSAAQVPVPIFLLHQPTAASETPKGRQNRTVNANKRRNTIACRAIND